MTQTDRILESGVRRKTIIKIPLRGKLNMQRYQSRRHQRLMDESEQALLEATDAKSRRKSRIAKHVLSDPKMHRLWEARHAELVRPVADQRKRAPQVFALRDIEVRLVHRRALFDHIRHHELRGLEREQMFAAFYGPKDIQDAILLEHRQYMLAVSSHLSTHHLINVMYDPLGNRLLRQYATLYREYFDLYGYVVRSQEAAWADAAKPLMSEAREQMAIVRQHINSEQPDKRHADFDQQALLARSGRYPILDYMVG